MNELLDLYLDGLDMDGRRSPKTRYDYRDKADSYLRPLLGAERVRDVTPKVILATLMLANGVPPKVAAERLGHADPTLFTNLYSHVTPTMQRQPPRRSARRCSVRPDRRFQMPADVVALVLGHVPDVRHPVPTSLRRGERVEWKGGYRTPALLLQVSNVARSATSRRANRPGRRSSTPTPKSSTASPSSAE
jgi:hypothetical protein